MAKSLKVSHAAFYRYYNGKTALWNAVTERWLARLQVTPDIVQALPWTRTRKSKTSLHQSRAGRRTVCHGRVRSG
ncbi:MAG: TetR/AcrR family transcriptional regulator [Negativicutes bacterium]|nr:TetR/AcrR family transcriptional regulator [Negativicutes bacterium]